jgi:hypothetical protein
MPAQAGIQVRIRLELKTMVSGFHRNDGKKKRHQNEEFQPLRRATERSSSAGQFRMIQQAI